MKRVVSFIAAVALILTLFTGAAKYPSIERYVNDFANVITEQDEYTMTLQAEQLAEKTKAQVVVVTVQSLNGEGLEDYSYHLANAVGIGDEKLDNGILLLLSLDPEDRGVRTEIGRGLEGAIPDGKSGRITDTYGMPYFIEGEYSTGLTKMVDSIVNEIYLEYGVEPDPDYRPVGDRDFGDASAGEIISFIMVVIVLLIFFSGGRRGRVRFLPLFFGGGPRFYGGHGGFSGRSGGGFGGFSGGGGSFGGGGSSRRF